MNEPNFFDESRDQEFADLLAVLMDRSQDQESLDLEATCKEYPEFAVELRELWGTIVFAQAAGSDHSVSDQPLVGSRPTLDLPYDLGDYILEEEIGRGGMGVVFRATRASDQHPVAIKMILSGDFASEAERKRFIAEAEAAALLTHPNIVPIFEMGEHNGMPFYCMKYIEGQTLSQRLAAGPLPTRRAAVMLQKICNAIQYAHQQGVLHRDVKPSNILIDEDGEPFVVDFGLAKRRSSKIQTLTKTGAVLGTPSYMSPEQAAGAREQVDIGSDVYALGAVLYHMVTGTPPFLGETPVDTLLMVMEQDPINPRVLNGRIHRDLEGIVLRCLQKPKDLRYQSASSLSDDLEAFLNELPVSARDGRFHQIVGHLLRETHHVGVLEQWGVLWMWHSLVLLVTSFTTHAVYKSGATEGGFYVFTWTSGFVVWAFVFWWLRRQMGPVTFVERQIAHVWGAAMCLVVFIYPIELALGLEPLDLAPFLAVVTGVTFVAKAGILSGSFYIQAIALFACAVVMIFRTDCAMMFYGVTSAACFFFPGLKYYRRKKENLLKSETNSCP